MQHDQRAGHVHSHGTISVTARPPVYSAPSYWSGLLDSSLPGQFEYCPKTRCSFRKTLCIIAPQVEAQLVETGC
jgi:hypothetical protein